MKKAMRPQSKDVSSRNNDSDMSDIESSIKSDNMENPNDSKKFKQLKESKRRFIDEMNEDPMQGDLKQRMDILVKKAEMLANFLLTKHKYKE